MDSTSDSTEYYWYHLACFGEYKQKEESLIPIKNLHLDNK